MNRLIILALALWITSPDFLSATGCDPGTVSSQASFESTVRPATAEDVDPADGIVEIYLTARESTWDFGIESNTPVWTYNGVIPGPTIEANVGDTLIATCATLYQNPPRFIGTGSKLLPTWTAVTSHS